MMENRSTRLRGTIWTCSWLILLVSPSTVAGSGREGDKVELVLYYETLCPYCSNFIVNHLPKVFDNGLVSHLDLKLVPYGNARIGVNDTISCQRHFWTRRSLKSSNNQLIVDAIQHAFCANFIVNHLAKIFDSDLISHVDLDLVPWGNAKMKGNATFDCQHGPPECLLNTVEACAIDIWPDLNEHFPLIYCIEKLVFSHNYAQWESCFEPLGLDSKLVSDCYAGGRGKELELGYAAETNALQPPHQYVPWVVVDGKPLYDDYENFMSYICEAYSGTAKPEACSELSVNRVQRREARKTHAVCYMKEKMSSLAFKAVRSAVESISGWTKMLLDV